MGNIIITLILLVTLSIQTGCNASNRVENNTQTAQLADLSEAITSESAPPIASISATQTEYSVTISPEALTVERAAEAYNDKIINFTFTQVIDSALPPFTFRVSGETVRDPQVIRIDSISVNDSDGQLIQEIDNIDAWPRDATQYNLYGLEFGDYNSDGYLDISVRRFPGESQDNRTHYFWLWDKDPGQFVYDWKLSEAMTEDNYFEYELTHCIHEEMAPFTFCLIGRFIEGWSDELQETVENADVSIHEIRIIDSNGNIIQQLDGFSAQPPSFADSYGLYFADYNFDGFLDIALYMAKGGSACNEPHIYWLWDKDSGQFILNRELTEISWETCITVNEERHQIRAFSCGAGANNI